MNELEARGYRVTDLNKDGLSANADLVAAKGGKICQIQVKGAANKSKRWWVQYGHCTQEIIDRKRKVFNRKDSFIVQNTLRWWQCARQKSTGALFYPCRQNT